MQGTINEWEKIYRTTPLHKLPWHSEKPAEYLVTLLTQKKIHVGKALDVCCGAGTNAVYLAGNGFRVTGIDISSTAIHHAKKRAQQQGVAPDCTFLAGNILTIQLPYNEFDFIFDRGCYHHIPLAKKPYFARLIAELLKKNGHYFLSCFSDKNEPWEKNVSKEEIKNNFSPYFSIGRIQDYINVEDATGASIYFYLVLMRKKSKIK